MARQMFGRTKIKTELNEVNRENILDLLDKAIITHQLNRSQISYLYEYYKGRQPILDKVKNIRPEINFKITENRANSIVAFKVGYTIGKPIQYISADADNGEVVNRLNAMMRSENKVTKDRKLVEWQMICGTGYRLVLPKKYPSSVPFELYTLDPMNTFVVYSCDYTERPICAFTYYLDELNNATYTAYTEDTIFTLKNNKVIAEEPNTIGLIPIVEYPSNSAKLGVFEVVLPILDAVNEIDSNRLDSLAQFVESLLVLYNADVEEGTTADTIRQAGMILLNNVGDRQADVKVISETINQTDNETLKNSLLQSINEIVGVPSQGDGNSSDSSNNGAVILRNGWQGAETRAQDFEAMFQEPERRMLEIVKVICDKLTDFKFNVEDLEVKFTRRNYEALTQKSQTLNLLLNTPYVHPKDAYEASGLFFDTQEAYRNGIMWEEEKTKEVNDDGMRKEEEKEEQVNELPN